MERARLLVRALSHTQVPLLPTLEVKTSMHKFKKPARFLIAFVSLAVAFLLSIQFSDRGVQFDLKHSDGAAADGEKKKYVLSDLRILNRVLLHLKDSYVEPERIDPSRMLVSALEEIQNSIAEVVVHYEHAPNGETPKIIKVSVNSSSRDFEIGRIESLWEMSFKLKEIFGFIQETLGDDPDVKYQDIEYAAINGMLETLDPHSTLLPPKNYEEMQTQTGGKFGGLGVVISVRDGSLTVISPIEGTPAAKKGIKAQDKIVRIGEQSTVNMELNDAVNMLRGEPGTKVTLWLLRKGWEEPRKFEVERAIIKIESVTSQPLANKIGYLRIKNFQANTYADTKRHLEELSEKMGGLQGLVLDLRGNPGGLLDQSIRISDLFIDSGALVSTVGQGNRMRDKKMAQRGGTEPKYPIIVLVNPGSASASEIVSGALQNNDRGVVLGDTTFGKGSVQVIYEFPDKSALKLTVAQYLTPGGISIQGRGIVPDLRTIPVTVERGAEIDMFLSRNVLREGDLATALTNDNVEDRKNEIFVRYLRQSSTTSSEETEDPDAFKEDFEINLAQKLLVAAGDKWKRPEMIEAIKPELASIGEKESEAIREQLAKQAVDWSRGAQVKEPSFKLDYELSTPPGEAIAAGSSATITARVTNTGTQPFHQLKAITDSDNGILSDREFIFGKVNPGETREWKVDIKLPQDMSSRTDMVFFELSDAHTIYNKRAEASYPVAIEGKPRPHFGFVYAIEDANKDGQLQPGEEVKLRIFVHNTGEADSSETLVYLKNMSRDVADLRSGRDKLKTIAAGGHQVVEFSLQVKDKLPDSPEIELELDIYDALFREFSQKKFKLPVNSKAGTFEELDGHVVVSAAGADVHAGASEKMPAVARVTAAGSKLPLLGKQGDWFKVKLPAGDGWLPAKDGKRTGGEAPEPIEGVREVLAQSPIIGTWQPATMLTDKSTIDLDLKANDETSIKDYYIFVYNRTNSTVNTRKVRYQRVGKHDLELTSNVPLFEGMNRIAIYVRDGDGMTSTRSAYVFRK